MKLIELAEYPFRYAYRVENQRDKAAIEQLFRWAVQEYGHPAPMPEFWVTSHEHMQDAAKRADHYTTLQGQVYGWYSQKYPNKIFICDRIHPGSNKRDAAVVVHEIGHYLQDTTEKHQTLKPFGPEHVETLELDADELMNRYLQSS
jgi:hypothetical protein